VEEGEVGILEVRLDHHEEVRRRMVMPVVGEATWEVEEGGTLVDHVLEVVGVGHPLVMVGRL
jgi:hypothetical protein